MRTETHSCLFLLGPSLCLLTMSALVACRFWISRRRTWFPSIVVRGGELGSRPAETKEQQTERIEIRDSLYTRMTSRWWKRLGRWVGWGVGGLGGKGRFDGGMKKAGRLGRQREAFLLRSPALLPRRDQREKPRSSQGQVISAGGRLSYKHIQR